MVSTLMEPFLSVSKASKALRRPRERERERGVGVCECMSWACWKGWERLGLGKGERAEERVKYVLGRLGKGERGEERLGKGERGG